MKRSYKATLGGAIATAVVGIAAFAAAPTASAGGYYVDEGNYPTLASCQRAGDLGEYYGDWDSYYCQTLGFSGYELWAYIY